MRVRMPWHDGARCGQVVRMPDLAEALRAALPEKVALGRDDGAALWPGEAFAAVPKRMTEFRAGRAAARHGLRLLNVSEAAIPMAANRAPVWPAEVTGSISHCAGACLAVVAKCADFRGIGLDLEPANPLPPELWQDILMPSERRQMKGLSGLMALRFFVAKEAAYKAQFAVTKRLLDFHDMEIIAQDQDFSARFAAPVPPFPQGYTIAGNWVEVAGFIAAFAAIPQGS